MSFFQCVIRMIVRKPQSYIGLLWNAVVVSAIIFCYLLPQYHPQFRLVNQNLENMFIAIFCILITCAFFSLLYSLAVLYRGRQHQLAILLLLGIRSRQLRSMRIIETFIIGILSVGLGVLGGIEV